MQKHRSVLLLSWYTFLCLLHQWEPTRAEYQLHHALELFKFGALSDTTCSPLVSPDHGEYQCQVNSKGQQVCKLQCHPGYMVPFTHYHKGKRLSFQERGVYTCMKKEGLPIAWYPIGNYDCVEIVYPTTIELYYYLKVPLTPRPCNSLQAGQMQRTFLAYAKGPSHTAKLCQATNTTCTWSIYVTCVVTVWQVDIVISFPFSKSLLVDWPKAVNREMLKDIPHFRVKEQTGGQTKKGRRAFRIVCPAGTRISQDFLCHGCSPGYYMDESLMECQPCPKRYYQDVASQTVCKPCPSDTPGSSIGGKHIASCYSITELTKSTDLLTATSFITALVAVVSILLAFRYRIQEDSDSTAPKPSFPGPGRYQSRISMLSNKAVILSRKASTAGDKFGRSSRARKTKDAKREKYEGEIPMKHKDMRHGVGKHTHDLLMRSMEEGPSVEKIHLKKTMKK